MRYLRAILISVYVILALLLLWGTCRDRNFNQREESQIAEHRSGPILVEDSLAVERARAIGQQGHLKVTLLWDFPADIDLHVLEPTGETIDFGNKRSSKSDGFLDRDNRVGGHGAAENIFWRTPPHGKYQISVKYYGKVGTVPTFDVCRVVVFKRDENPIVYEVTFNEVGEKKKIATVEI